MSEDLAALLDELGVDDTRTEDLIRGYYDAEPGKVEVLIRGVLRTRNIRNPPGLVISKLRNGDHLAMRAPRKRQARITHQEYARRSYMAVREAYDLDHSECVDHATDAMMLALGPCDVYEVEAFLHEEFGPDPFGA